LGTSGIGVEDLNLSDIIRAVALVDSWNSSRHTLSTSGHRDRASEEKIVINWWTS
jgi:hypothetical protein